MPIMTDLIHSYGQRLRAAGRSPYTINARTRVLRRAARLLPNGLESACGDELAAYLASLRTNWTKATYYSALNGFYGAMVKAGHLDFNPMSAVDRPASGDATPNPVTTDELVAALELSPGQPWRGAIILGAYAGLRCAEMVDLTRADVTRERVHVRHGKGGRARYIPTHPAVWDLVRGCGAGPVLTWRLPLTPERLTCSQGRHWQSIGMPDVHLHRFRHWFGTTLVDEGVGIEVVCELMGHRSIATTQGYVRVSQAKRDAAILRLPVQRIEPGSSRLDSRATTSAA